jgi:hypothetical protein
MCDLQIAALLVRCSKLRFRYFVLVFDRCRRLKVADTWHLTRCYTNNLLHPSFSTLRKFGKQVKSGKSGS